MSSTEPILTMRGIEKSFGAEVKALKGVDFEVRPGEIVALLGENGAGKSTLLKAITGVHTPTAGEVRWFGEPVVLDSPAKARDLGIRTVYQELNLAPHLSVAANIYLGAEPMRALHYYPVEWFMIDEHRGWLSCQFWNRMADPGDGSVHEFACFSLLKYAGDGLWSFEEDKFDPAEMQTSLQGWLDAKKRCQEGR